MILQLYTLYIKYANLKENILKFANILDENTQKFIGLISKACDNKGIPVKLMTDATSIAIHQFVLPLKHGFATVNLKSLLILFYHYLFLYILIIYIY